MIRCPHCGEPATEVQEKCFACGQYLRKGDRGVRLWRQGLPRQVVLFALIGVVSVLAVALSTLFVRPSRAGTAQVPQARRLPKTSRREPPKGRRPAGADRRGERVLGRVEKMEQRFADISARLADREVSPEVNRMMAEIKAGLAKMKLLASSLGAVQTRAEQDSLQRLVAETERSVGALISRLSRAR